MTPFDIQSPLPPRKPILDNNQDIVAPIPAPEKPSAVNRVADVEEIVVAKPTITKKGFSLPGWSIWLFILLVVLLILTIIFKVLLPSLAGKPPVVETKLVYWGLWENGNIMAGVLSDFEKENPGVKVEYKMTSRQDYRNRLQARLTKTGSNDDVPDVFRYHSSWLPMLGSDLEPVPSSIATKIGLDTDFHDVYKELIQNGKYLGVPLMYDNLALFCNRAIFESAQAQFPKTWWGLDKLARKLTVKDGNGQISTAGVAMGITGNVDHWSDIVALLMKQNGVDPYKSDEANTEKLQNILTFYTLFKSKDAVWDETMPNSTTAFAQGKLAMYFAPSWRVFDVLALNPKLDFEVTNVPQLPTLDGVDLAAIENGTIKGSLTDKQLATYWVEGVSKNSPHKDLAFKLLAFLAKKESLEKVYAAASQVRSFGPLYPRKSMKESIIADSKIKPFVSVADKANSWYMSSFTHDSPGLNDRMMKYFEDAITATIVQQVDKSTTLKTLQSGIVQLQNQYKLTVLP